MNVFQRGKKPALAIPDQVWRDPLYFIAFGFGSGTIPFAPGTFGTLLAIPFYLLFCHLSLIFYVTFVIIVIIGSSVICDYVSRQLQVHDHPGMCLDEFAGFFVTMIHAPCTWQWILAGFILFRIFDIFKPFPIRTIDEKVHGGFGMVLDDVVAGIFAAIIIQLALLFF